MQYVHKTRNFGFGDIANAFRLKLFVGYNFIFFLSQG